MKKSELEEMLVLYQNRILELEHEIILLKLKIKQLEETGESSLQ